MTPTQRSLSYLKARDIVAAVVEHWNPFVRIRQDLFQFADILAVDPVNQETKFIQVTSGSNVSARVKKIATNQKARAVLKAGNTIEVHGWRKTGPRGKRKTWDIRIVPIRLADLD